MTNDIALFPKLRRNSVKIMGKSWLKPFSTPKPKSITRPAPSLVSFTRSLYPSHLATFLVFILSHSLLDPIDSAYTWLSTHLEEPTHTQFWDWVNLGVYLSRLDYDDDAMADLWGLCTDWGLDIETVKSCLVRFAAFADGFRNATVDVSGAGEKSISLSALVLPVPSNPKKEKAAQKDAEQEAKFRKAALNSSIALLGRLRLVLVSITPELVELIHHIITRAEDMLKICVEPLLEKKKEDAKKVHLTEAEQRYRGKIKYWYYVFTHRDAYDEVADMKKVMKEAVTQQTLIPPPVMSPTGADQGSVLENDELIRSMSMLDSTTPTTPRLDKEEEASLGRSRSAPLGKNVHELP
ncbi:hypothetical protein M501DRAFT_992107 [Patellaria atrata CBS 101060]|uniref:Uncharacterized protein n=1 Tax=Patellaria atrata CBS 101060 TaxID=1346257 RepID=A0A9P4SCI8_9PEZI|nr:hypothetical protein M501DRAFT_992107 [Patellaria atrata CBS 101060]